MSKKTTASDNAELLLSISNELPDIIVLPPGHKGLRDKLIISSEDISKISQSLEQFLASEVIEIVDEHESDKKEIAFFFIEFLLNVFGWKPGKFIFCDRCGCPKDSKHAFTAYKVPHVYFCSFVCSWSFAKDQVKHFNHSFGSDFINMQERAEKAVVAAMVTSETFFGESHSKSLKKLSDSIHKLDVRPSLNLDGLTSKTIEGMRNRLSNAVVNGSETLLRTCEICRASFEADTRQPHQSDHNVHGLYACNIAHYRDLYERLALLQRNYFPIPAFSKIRKEIEGVSRNNMSEFTINKIAKSTQELLAKTLWGLWDRLESSGIQVEK